WLQSYLSRVGIRAINNVVDLTNYYMHLTGQPLHAYDYDKLVKIASGQSPGASLGVRRSRPGDKINLLNGKALELQDDSTVLITSNDVPVGIGGVMGGAETEVDENTKNIVLECANFDMYNIRRTAMKYGLFTDAVTRFTKGQSPLQNDRILAKTMADIISLAGANQASDVKDIHGDLPQPKQVIVSKDFINARLGSQLSAEDMANLLRNVEFNVDITNDGHPEQSEGSQDSSAQSQNDRLVVTVPFWRTDIEIPEDIVEEVGRLFGYDKLAQDLPRRSITPSPTDPLIATKTLLRNILSAAGANEVLSYTFVHGDLLTKTGQNKEHAYQLANALSPDLQYYRLSLTPSLLEKVQPNLRQGFNEFALFEINPVHAKGFVDNYKLPIEDQRLALVFAADAKTAAHKYAGAPYYQAKQYLADLLAELGITSLVFEPATSREPDQPISQAAIAPFEKLRSAIVKTKDGQFIGEVGEFKTSVRKNLKLPNFTAGFELDVNQLSQLRAKTKAYTPIPRFPKVEQDITLSLPTKVAFADLQDYMEEQLETPAKSAFWLTPLAIYRENAAASSQNVSFRLSIASYERTLTTEEVNQLLDKVAAAAKTKFAAERV
ncbi:MAG: phenylalanine--tRNA ligase subunit beta, partial [Candidatus Saccharimonadales bacterium]